MKAVSRGVSPILGTASALITAASNTLITGASTFQHTFEAPVEAIEPNPSQPRRVFEHGGIRALALTMAAEGQLQPILLRRGHTANAWIIVAGERRWRAAQVNGWSTILAIEHTGDAEVAALLENLQRVDLSPVEEAKGLQRLIEEKAWTQDRAAEALGKSKGDISAVLGILSLPEPVLEAVLTSELNLAKHVLIELARVPLGARQDRLLALAHAGKLTIRAIRAVRAAEADGSADGPAKPAPDMGPGLSRMDRQALDRLAGRLRALRLAGTRPNDAEREQLLRVQQEIAELLELPDVGSRL